MIKIVVDNNKEFTWIRRVIDCGTLNFDDSFLPIWKVIGIDSKQEIQYCPSEDYIDDPLPEILQKMVDEKYSFDEIKSKCEEMLNGKLQETNKQ